jgi:hypothetical protein
MAVVESRAGESAEALREEAEMRRHVGEVVFGEYKKMEFELRWMMVHEGLRAPVGAGAVSVPTAAVEGDRAVDDAGEKMERWHDEEEGGEV